MVRQIRVIVVLVGLLAVSVSGSIFGQSTVDIQWSAPQVLGDGWWQSIALDRQGEVHVGWYGSGDPKIAEVGGDVFNYTRRPLNGDWTATNNVLYTGVGGFTIRNAMAVTTDGILHLAYRSSVYHSFSSAYSLMAENAHAWSSPLQINTTGYYVDMTVDRHDVLHLVTSERLAVSGSRTGQDFAELNPCALCHDLFYRRSTDGGQSWSEPYPISLNPRAGSDRMNIFEGVSSGRLYIVWDEGFDWYISRGAAQDVRIVYSDDGGSNWSDPIILDGGNLTDRKPVQLAVTELRDESLLAVWRYDSNADRNIYYQVSSDLGTTWTEPAPIPGMVTQNADDSTLDDYELIVDRIGTVHLFAAGQPDVENTENASLYDVVYRQGVWLPPQRIYFSNMSRPEWPKAVVGPQNDIHLVWFTRGTLDERGQPLASNTAILKVYYSHLPGIIPLEATQAFSPTRTPYPTPTVFQNLAATPTPFPTIGTVDSSVTVTTQDQYASQTLVAGLFAATLFCAGILIVIRLRRGG